tara:strand:- start:620 stop:829 length:210 start_codon:yes stop_codon:yes gene_type:complete
MGLLHCPLCVGLAVLSALRFSAHAVLAFQLRSECADHADVYDDLLGSVQADHQPMSVYCSDTTQAVAAR